MVTAVDQRPCAARSRARRGPGPGAGRRGRRSRAASVIKVEYQCSSAACGSRSGSDQSSLESLEGLVRLRIGYVAAPPAVRGELVAPPGPHRRGDRRVGVVGEVLPRRRGAPLLAHEQHRRPRPGEQQRRTARQQTRGRGRCSAGRPSRGCRPGRGSAARRRTASPACASGRPAGRGCAAGTSSRCRRGGTPARAPWSERPGSSKSA